MGSSSRQSETDGSITGNHQCPQRNRNNFSANVKVAPADTPCPPPPAASPSQGQAAIMVTALPGRPPSPAVGQPPLGAPVPAATTVPGAQVPRNTHRLCATPPLCTYGQF